MKDFKAVEGVTVGRIYMDDKHLTLITDKGKFSFGVSEEACPRTFFCDFYGANHLFGQKIIGIKPIPVSSRNRHYYAILPRYRAMMKTIRQRAVWDMKSPLPAIHGYEIITSAPNGNTHTSIFSFQESGDNPSLFDLVETTEHVTDEEFRIFKPQFRVTPRH